MKFGNLYHSFSEWEEVRAVATKASLHFIHRSLLPTDMVLYTDEDEWTGWKKIGDSVLHIELRRWADLDVSRGGGDEAADVDGDVVVGEGAEVLDVSVEGAEVGDQYVPEHVAPAVPIISG